MTREEAIESIEGIKSYYTDDRDFSYYGDEYEGLTDDDNEALDMAIKALEQQPCDDDCISRDDVLTNLRLNWRLYESAEDAIKMSIYDVSNMDSINPKQAKAEIEKEEPAKWIVDTDDSRRWDRVRFYCSSCNSWNTYGKSKYCPNCGAKMEEDAE